MDKSDQILQLIAEMNNTMTVMDSKMTVMDSKITVMENNITEMQTEIKEVKSDIKDIKMTLENETNKNIKVIAEGHCDLGRKLNDSLKIEHEKEMLLIRVTILENEVRRIKEQIEEIA